MIGTVTTNALIKRINRKLAPEGERLRTYRGRHWNSDLGWHYIIDVNRNGLVQGHVDVEKLAREMGVMREHEQIAQEAA